MNCFLIDMDGTVYRGEDVIAEAVNFINHLQEKSIPYLFATNCPHKSPKRIAQKLQSFGIAATENQIITSATVCAEFLKYERPLKSVYLVGSDDFRDILIDFKIEINDVNPDIVLVGYDTEFTYEKMKKASIFISDGSEFIGTNEDATIPFGSKKIPHTGALLNAITTATNVSPLIIGKPYRYMFDYAIFKLNCKEPEECTVIGDRLDTDILFAKNNNAKSCLVLTGETKREDLLISSVIPDLTIESLKELY